jgi:hypothetical protein
MESHDFRKSAVRVQKQYMWNELLRLAHAMRESQIGEPLTADGAQMTAISFQ